MNTQLKLALILLLTSLLTGIARAQHSLTGTVVWEDSRKPVAGVLLSVHAEDGKSLLARSISAQDGRFVIKLKALPEGAILRARSLGAEPYELRLSPGNKPLVIALSAKAERIREVVVEADLIRLSGDTLTYMGSQFAQSNDRVLADLLKRLPGIEVQSNGQILYQGKPISKFYIEGKDILKGRYGLATNNLDVNKIASVQVLERHQPIRALQGVEMPSTAAVNIRLRKSALGAFFANLRLGAGLPLGELSNSISAMRFTPKHQNILIYKQDNSGGDIAQELRQSYGNIGLAPSAHLGVQGQGGGRKPFNDSHYLSLNNLYGLDSLSTLGLNLLYLYDRRWREQAEERSVYQGPSHTGRLEERLRDTLRKHDSELKLEYEHNGTKAFTNNKLRLFWDKVQGNSAVQRPLQQLAQATQLPSYGIANQYKVVRRQGEHIYKLTADLAYRRSDHSLELRPATAIGEVLQLPDLGAGYIRQTLLHDTYAGSLSLSYSHKSKYYRWGIDPELSIEHNRLSSALGEWTALASYRRDIPQARNELRHTTMRLGSSVTLSYDDAHRWKWTIRVPIDLELQRGAQGPKWYLRPRPWASLEYKPSSRWYINGLLSYSDAIGDYSNELTDYILSDYRTLRRRTNLTPRRHQIRSNVAGIYRDHKSGFFVNLHYGLEAAIQNELTNLIYRDGTFDLQSIDYRNTSLQHNLGSGTSFYLKPLRGNVSLGAQLNWGSGTTLTEGYASTYHNWGYGLSQHSELKLSKALSVSLENRLSWQKSSVGKFTSTFRSQSHYLSLHLKLGDKWTFSPQGTLILDSSSGVYSVARMASARLSYRPQKRLEFVAELSNIFDTRQFVSYRHLAADLERSEYLLRPRQFMLQCAFSL